MSRHRKIPKRPRFYVGCEGQSEVSYLGLILHLCKASDVRITIVRDDLSSGDPLSRVREAKRRIKQKEASREAFKACFILLDQDQADAEPQKALEAIKLADESGIDLIWQSPCHEGLLLRHLAGHENDQPANAQLAQQALLKVWPEYSKPMDTGALARRLAIEEVARAASNDHGLADLLNTFGLPLA